MKIKGTVVQGIQQAGGTFGVETANLDIEKDHQEEGVFIAVTTYKSNKIPSIAFLGTANLVPGKPWRFEVHLLEGEYDLYEQELEVELKDKLRDPLTFTSEEEAKTQIDQDIALAKQYFNKK